MARLALISAIVLPITAVATIYGVNLLMIGVSAVMLWWARRQGWW